MVKSDGRRSCDYRRSMGRLSFPTIALASTFLELEGRGRFQSDPLMSERAFHDLSPSTRSMRNFQSSLPTLSAELSATSVPSADLAALKTRTRPRRRARVRCRAVGYIFDPSLQCSEPPARTQIAPARFRCAPVAIARPHVPHWNDDQGPAMFLRAH